MDGYYLSRIPGASEEAIEGQLEISVTNLPEFNELLQQAEKEACQLNKTLDRLRSFNLTIHFSVPRERREEEDER